MEFRTALLFLFLYYIRPQDWIPSITGFNIIRPMIIIWLVSLISARTRPAISGVLRTPHDWAMLAYYVYVVWNSPDQNATLKGFLPYVVFYAFTIRSLTTWERVLGYLKFWNLMLIGVAALAVASLYGVDIVGAKDMTDKFLGRLCIGTWLHDNPNALAHSVIVILPLSFVLYFWNNGIIGRAVLFPACAVLACYCVYETESKGAFLVGGILFVMIFVVGRPKFVQILVLAMAATMGVSALSFLPRMEKMGDLRSDHGVQGRLMVWEMARNVTEKKSSGEGWKQFQGSIVWLGQIENKATHSSYVKVSADLGVYGLFFYLLPMWLALRSLLTSTRLARDEPDKERCRRAAMLLIIAYMISGWMINREYHIEYFLIVAVAAAIHRLHLAEEQEVVMAAQKAALKQESGEPPEGEEEEHLPVSAATPAYLALYETGQRLWNRITVVDVGLAAAMTWAVLFTWDYVLENL